MFAVEKEKKNKQKIQLWQTAGKGKIDPDQIPLDDPEVTIALL